MDIDTSSSGLIAASDRVMVPPKENLEVLLELAQEGRLKKLAEACEAIVQKNPQYQPFIHKIAQFAKNFQTEKIEDLIQQEHNNYVVTKAEAQMLLLLLLWADYKQRLYIA